MAVKRIVKSIVKTFTNVMVRGGVPNVVGLGRHWIAAVMERGRVNRIVKSIVMTGTYVVIKRSVTNVVVMG